MIGYIFLGIAILALLFVVYQYAVSNSIQIVRLPITTKRALSFSRYLPERIVIFSDLHNHRFGTNNSKLVDTIRAQYPDLILIPGDLVVGDNDNIKIVTDLLRDLCSLGVPVFVSLGNHEGKLRKRSPELYRQLLAETVHENLHILDNRCDYLADHVLVCGVTLPEECYKRDGRDYRFRLDDLSEIQPQPGPTDYCIMLAHTPYYFETYSDFGADLVVSGHNHGGLIRFPNKGGLISPQREFFPEFDAGIYEYGASRMVVTRGLGTHFPLIRIFNRPELLVLEFYSGKK